ncbi:type II toxin-antitoxin system RelE/ParE family toxin [Treponema maltophilum]|uniref:type II toxin-antitoxin system RelE/ParE family toxin n=1 Tax=Treponema maltophilum TaxID=51160 RepID=UPI003D8A4E56
MAYKVRIADTAKVNLDEIIRYIAEKLSNSKAAVSLLADFEKCKNNLKDLPYMYPLCNDTRLQKKGYRRFLFYKNYVALYSINDKGKIVNILHIFYAKCDYAKSV